MKTSITVACSRWDEPFGRTSLEASANGCAVIITNKGGLPETVTDAKILDNLNEKSLTKNIYHLITNPTQRKKLQYLSIKNFYLTHKFISKKIDDYRSEKIYLNKKISFILKQVNDVMSQWIKDQPENWLWIHRRWQKDLYI